MLLNRAISGSHGRDPYLHSTKSIDFEIIFCNSFPNCFFVKTCSSSKRTLYRIGKLREIKSLGSGSSLSTIKDVNSNASFSNCSNDCFKLMSKG